MIWVTKEEVNYGDDLSNQRMVQKLLISLPKTYDGITSISLNVSKCFAFSSAAIFLSDLFHQRIHKKKVMHLEV